MLRGYKCRLLPTNEQITILNNWRISSSKYHNFLLHRQTQYEELRLNAVAAGCTVKDFYKSIKDLHWPKEYKGSCDMRYLENGMNAYQNGTNTFGLPSSVANGVLKNLSESWKRVFGSKFGKPKFFKDGELSNLNFNISTKIIGTGKKRYVSVQTLKTKIKFITDRDIPQNIKRYTISECNQKWYISFTVDDGNVPKTQHSSSTTTQIDFGGYDQKGIKRYLQMEPSGDVIYIPDSTKRTVDKCETKILMLSKKLSRQQKFGKNWNKTKKQLKKYHQMKVDSMDDFIHKTTHDISEDYCGVTLANLDIKSMTKSSKGTNKVPGKNVKVKSKLTKKLLNNKYYKFKQCLEYKLIEKGGKMTIL